MVSDADTISLDDLPESIKQMLIDEGFDVQPSVKNYIECYDNIVDTE